MLIESLLQIPQDANLPPTPTDLPTQSVNLIFDNETAMFTANDDIPNRYTFLWSGFTVNDEEQPDCNLDLDASGTDIRVPIGCMMMAVWNWALRTLLRQRLDDLNFLRGGPNLLICLCAGVRIN